MTYVRMDGSVANYNFAEYTARYRKRMGRYYCQYCGRSGTMVMYNRHCTSMMHISAKELYEKRNPPPAPVVIDEPPIVLPKQLPKSIPQKCIPDSVCIIDLSPENTLKPPPLVYI